MLIKTVIFENLQKQDSWKVEFYCNDNIVAVNSQFKMVTIQEIVEERKETLDPQSEHNKLFSYIGLENIESLTGDLINFAPKLGKTIKSRSKIFYSGDILYGRLRPYLNKVYLASEPITSGICSGEFYVLIPDSKKVLPNYLRTILASKYIQNYVKNLQTGSALPRLRIKNLLSLKVPLPPMEVQLIQEKYIIEQNSYRKKLAAELFSLPNLMIETVLNNLES